MTKHTLYSRTLWQGLALACLHLDGNELAIDEASQLGLQHLQLWRQLEVHGAPFRH